MPDNKSELHDLVERARAGDQGAIRELVEEWTQPLLYVINRKMCQQLRAVMDPEDIAQSAFRSFLTGDFIHPRCPRTREDLLRLLLIIGRN